MDATEEGRGARTYMNAPIANRPSTITCSAATRAGASSMVLINIEPEPSTRIQISVVLFETENRFEKTFSKNECFRILTEFKIGDDLIHTNQRNAP